MPEEDKEKEALQKANADLEAANHFKMHLLTLTSHQMKTPLGIIRGYTALLREGFYGEIDPRAKEVVAMIDLRKAEEGRIEYQMQNLDFVKLARQAAEELGHMATSKGLNLSFEGPEGEIMIYGDEQKLRHVIQNLVDNAVKYTEKGFIHVKLEKKDDAALFSVADSGIGIPADVKPFLFEEFIRDERVKREIRGTGLGLHVAKVFTEAQQGKIWAESDGEGKGSTFYVSIPTIAASSPESSSVSPR